MKTSSSSSVDRHASSSIPIGVVVLGLVSFLTDLSSETIFAVLPIYFVTVVGGSPMLLGVMEGLADFAASSLDLASGYLADRVGHRKWIAWIGYAVSTLAKTLLVVVTSAVGVLSFRVIERLGKSIRGAPRDALLATLSPHHRRGMSFGLHKAMDRAGAVLGPAMAWLVLTAWGTNADAFHWLFIGALIPAVIAVVLMATGVRDVPVAGPTRLGPREAWRRLAPRYKWYLLSKFVFALGYFSFAFLLLKARDVGFKAQDQALLYGLSNLAFTLVSIPIGWLGDRLGRRVIVGAGFVVHVIMSAGFMVSASPVAVIIMFAIYGVFFAIDEGQSKAYLADLTDDDTRATAIGLYGFVTGLAYLPASLIAGSLWSIGPAWTFGFAIGTSLVALAIFIPTSKSSHSQ